MKYISYTFTYRYLPPTGTSYRCLVDLAVFWITYLQDPYPDRLTI